MTRRILFCTIGRTPQVVTETVWALKKQRRWVANEIHVVTTTFALQRIRSALQHPRGRLAVLFDGRLPPVTVYVPRRHGSPAVFPPITATDGWSDDAEAEPPPLPIDDDALADVNSEPDAALMGDLILQLMAGFVRDDDSEVHVSLAGGRKTMSAHALLAMTLVARRRDQASHVLVSPADFEDHPDFWHPDQGWPIAAKQSSSAAAAKQLDPRKAQVTLVRTQTPLMRYEVKNIAALENLRLVDIVNQVNFAATLEANPKIRLLTAANTVRAGGVQVELGAKLFALFRLIATARKESWPGIGPHGTGDGSMHRGWLSVPHICFGKTPDGRSIDQIFLAYLIEAVRVSPTDNDTQDNKSIAKWKAVLATVTDGRKRDRATGAIGPNLTNLRKAFRKGFGAAAANMLMPPNREDGDLLPIPGEPPQSEDAPRFGLDIAPDGIEIV
jgi:CRISPR-associated protein (TIGR02584 family)